MQELLYHHIIMLRVLYYTLHTLHIMRRTTLLSHPPTSTPQHFSPLLVGLIIALSYGVVPGKLSSRAMTCGVVEGSCPCWLSWGKGQFGPRGNFIGRGSSPRLAAQKVANSASKTHSLKVLGQSLPVPRMPDKIETQDERV
jgi:hypothetical protein